LRGDVKIMHTAEHEKEAIYAASRAGMVDMYGALLPAIDGVNWDMNAAIVSIMRGFVESSLELVDTCKTWFEKVIDLQK
nr:DUF4392 domain-containing protein [Clostridia bacterium]